MPEDNAIEAHLEDLERRLLKPEIRMSPAEVGAMLADDFKEVAGTGEIFNKAQIIEMLRNAPPAKMELTDFKAVVLAPDVALAKFFYSRGATPDRPAAESIRSSVWKRIDGRWQMVFHQGTLSGER